MKLMVLKRFGLNVIRATAMCFSFWVIPSLAYGYIDPGTGSIALQVMFATVAAGWLFFGKMKRAIVNFFSRRS